MAAVLNMYSIQSQRERVVEHHPVSDIREVNSGPINCVIVINNRTVLDCKVGSCVVNGDSSSCSIVGHDIETLYHVGVLLGAITRPALRYKVVVTEDRRTRPD